MIRERKISGREIIGWLLICLSTGMLGRSILLCFSQDIWYDELFTVSMAEHSYGELVRFTAADVHPPLYYIIVKFFAELCKLLMPGTGTVIPAKLVSTLPFLLLLLYSVTWIRKRWGIFTGGLFLFCVTAMPQLPAYTVEVRMYGWALLFVTAAFWHAQGCLTENRRYLHGAAFVLYSLAAAYTQYFAAVAVGMVYLYLLIMFLCRDRSRLREWFCYVAISVVCYVPWLFALAGQISAVRENYWILPLSWRSLGGCVKFLMKPAFTNDVLNTVLAVVLFAAYVVVVGYPVLSAFMSKNKIKEKKLYRNGRQERGGFSQGGTDSGEHAAEVNQITYMIAGVGVLAGLVAFGFAASILIRPIFVYRYMIPALGCFWFSFALGMDGILCKPKYQEQTEDVLCKPEDRAEMKGKLCKLKTALALSLIAFIIAVGLRDFRAFRGEEEYKIVSMRETETALSLIAPEDTVIYNFDQVQAVTAYYLPESTERFLWGGSAESLIQEMIGPCGTLENVDEISELAGKEGNLWFIGSFNSRDAIVEEWREAGLSVEEVGSFLLERYWFNLYKIS
ncbi:MAG: hypothetical protein HDR05_13560 [Lachnospiraceae bacterium]|nr:hypothetical protein [Lachnospiraceae bacterium]